MDDVKFWEVSQMFISQILQATCSFEHMAAMVMRRHRFETFRPAQKMNREVYGLEVYGFDV